MSFSDVMAPLIKTPERFIEPLDPLYMDAFLCGCASVDGSVHDLLERYRSTVPGPSGFEVGRRAYMRMGSTAAVTTTLDGLDSYVSEHGIGDFEPSWAAEEHVMPRLCKYVKERRIGMVLLDLNLPWFFNFLNGVLVLRGEHDLPAVKGERTNIEQFERWLQTKRRHPNAGWYHIVRAYHGEGVPAIKQLAALWNQWLREEGGT